MNNDAPVSELVSDPDELRLQLTALTSHSGGDGSSNAVRQRAIDLLKNTIKTGLGKAESQLLADGSGTACARAISRMQDDLICIIYDFAATHVLRAINRTSAESMAIVAVGGYGRGTLAPSSDIDLLFLLPYKQTPWGESMVEYILYFLWDMGFKVGNATRNIDQALRLSKQDMTIRTSLLEARFIWGASDLFDELVDKFASSVMTGTKSEFIAAKLAERDERHVRSGQSRYLVEPDVKNGKGGLRDLHTLFWIGKYFYKTDNQDELVAAGVFSRTEFRAFEKAQDFLWAVRCHLHFATGRAQERLSFEIQPEIADRLNYKEHAGLRSVERFMRHYFLFAKDVGNLTRVFCSQLEEADAKRAPGLGGLIRSVTQRRRKIKGSKNFVNDKGRLNIANQRVFTKDPVELIRIFHVSLIQGLELHPDAMKLIHRSLKLIKLETRENGEANRLFMEILTAGEHSENILRRMNEAGVLGRFIRAFGKVVAMMQYSMYHHYTVDEHLLNTVGMLWKIRSGEISEEVPLVSSLIGEVTRFDMLYLALFLHDIAKGRPEDHSIAGARLAAKLCPRFGLNTADTELVSWLVAEHLTMNNIAQSRDLSDHKTIQDFANTVQSIERLRYLLILTVCDIRAVGPGVWNGWKGQLLRTLYFQTEPLLTGGFSTIDRDSHVEILKQELRESLLSQNADWGDQELKRVIELPYPAYFLSTSPESQARHMDLLRTAHRDSEEFATAVHTSRFEAVTQITILALDHHRLLSTIAGACAACDANIVDAKIHTLSNGMALDSIYVRRNLPTKNDELRRTGNILKLLKRVLSGESSLPEIDHEITKTRMRAKTFGIRPKVTIQNSLSDHYTVIEVEGLDRRGLLHLLTAAIADLHLNVGSAHVATFGEKIIDSFYVTDLTGQKLESEQGKQRIMQRLIAILDPTFSGANEAQ